MEIDDTHDRAHMRLAGYLNLAVAEGTDALRASLETAGPQAFADILTTRREEIERLMCHPADQAEPFLAAYERTPRHLMLLAVIYRLRQGEALLGAMSDAAADPSLEIGIGNLCMRLSVVFDQLAPNAVDPWPFDEELN
ncbi:MAG: hypothetical protein AAGG72_00100 [Pseudomonadota bacterium]